jgi:hypothetical protein
MVERALFTAFQRFAWNGGYGPENCLHLPVQCLHELILCEGQQPRSFQMHLETIPTREYGK